MTEVDDLLCDDLNELEREFLFAEIMWILSLVMDHCHYSVHLNIRNKPELSHRNGAKNVKTPFRENLKWSADPTREKQSDC